MHLRLIIVTTAPETVVFILKNQAKFLKKYFDIGIVVGSNNFIEKIKANEEVQVNVIKMYRNINLIGDFISLLRMIFYFLKDRPDIVHSYTPKAGLIAMLAAFICRVPVRIHTFTGLIWPTQNGIKHHLLKISDQIICYCATNIIPEGNGVLKDLRAGGITRKPLKVIGHGNIAGIDLDYYSNNCPEILAASAKLKQTYAINKNDFVFIFIGRLNRDKGLKELLIAFKKLPNNARLLILGELDKSLPIKNQELNEILSNPRIHFLGFQEDIRPALLVSKVLVLPSYREGFPNVILQAGAMERAVIASDISGCNEFITPGFNGWLNPPRDEVALELSMQKALEKPESDLLCLGHQSRSRIEERFERKKYLTNLLDFYNSCTSVRFKNDFSKKILLLASTKESLINFRYDLLEAIKAKGIEIHVAAPDFMKDDILEESFINLDWKRHGYYLERKGKSLVKDFYSFLTLCKLLWKIRPDYLLSYTIKPVIYGNIASFFIRPKKSFALITGPGFMFYGTYRYSYVFKKILTIFYAYSLSRVNVIFFQNSDDSRRFKELGLIRPGQVNVIVNGSGVNLTKFPASPLPSGLHFIMASRLLYSKGVLEYVEASRRLFALYPNVKFSLAGWHDYGSDSIPKSEFNTLINMSGVNFLGRISDIRKELTKSSVFILPSYHEGTPRSVLEAMSMGRPIITTDAPGCRETVIEGVNGFLVPVTDIDALVNAMEKFILDPSLIPIMGKRSREIAEEKYDVHKVNAVMLNAMGIT